MERYLQEAIIAGLVALCIGTFFSVAVMYSDPKFRISKIDFWVSLIVTNFLTGFVGHLIVDQIVK
jgi:ethanolamine transporter EutH